MDRAMDKTGHSGLIYGSGDMPPVSPRIGRRCEHVTSTLKIAVLVTYLGHVEVRDVLSAVPELMRILGSFASTTSPHDRIVHSQPAGQIQNRMFEPHRYPGSGRTCATGARR